MAVLRLPRARVADSLEQGNDYAAQTIHIAFGCQNHLLRLRGSISVDLPHAVKGGERHGVSHDLDPISKVFQHEFGASVKDNPLRVELTVNDVPLIQVRKNFQQSTHHFQNLVDSPLPLCRLQPP